MNEVIAGNAARSPTASTPHACRSTPRCSASRMPSVGASTVPPTTIFALLRNASGVLAAGGSHTASAHGASNPSACATLPASWAS